MGGRSARLPLTYASRFLRPSKRGTESHLPVDLGVGDVKLCLQLGE